MSSMNDCCLPVKNKPKSFVVNNFCGNKDAKEYSNLNLFCNKSFDSVQDNSKSSFNKEFGSKAAHKYEEKKNISFSKPSMFDSSLKIWNSEIVKNEAKKRWMNDISSSSSTTTNNNNNSTLSLHIAAYENSVAAVTKDSFGNENQSLKMKKIDSVLVRKRKIAKHTFVGSKFCIIQNPFEFARQQNAQPANPEVMQFKPTQQLADPNQQASTPAAAPPPAAPAAPGAPVQQPGYPPQVAPAQPGAQQQPAVVQVQVSPAPSPAQAYAQPQAYGQPAYAASPAPVANVYGCRQPTQVTCPACRAVVMTRMQTTMSSTDIIMLVIGFFFIFFVFGLVLLCIVFACSPWNDISHFCPQCGHFIGKA